MKILLKTTKDWTNIRTFKESTSFRKGTLYVLSTIQSWLMVKEQNWDESFSISFIQLKPSKNLFELSPE